MMVVVVLFDAMRIVVVPSWLSATRGKMKSTCVDDYSGEPGVNAPISNDPVDTRIDIHFSRYRNSSPDLG